MNKTYRLNGLDCANCAAKIEREVRKITGDDASSVNFIEKTASFPEAFATEIKQAVGRIEPEVEIVPVEGDAGTDDDEEEDGGRFTLLRIVVATLVFIPGLIFEKNLHALGPWIEYSVYLFAYLIVGWPVLRGAVLNVIRLNPFDEQFLMSVATLGAIAIHQLPEAVGVMLFYAVGEYFQDRAVDRSRRSIKALLDVRPDKARLVEGYAFREVKPEAVGIGTVLEIRAGERIPLDGEVISGNAQLDVSALTGESVPRNVAPGADVLAGSINLNALLRVRTTKRFDECSVSKIVKLVQEAAGKKARAERFITTFARWYTPVVVAGAVLVATVPPLVTGAAFSFWLYRALVLLVISCPCALVVSVPLGYFAGLGAASRKGILVKGGQFLDSLNDVSTVVLDKTGTLTEGVFEVQDVSLENGTVKEELLRYAALAESRSNHPIASAIRRAWGKSPDNELVDYEEVRGHGIKARLKNGQMLLAGNDRMLHRENIPHSNCLSDATVVYVALDGKLLGAIFVGDRLKADSPAAIERLRALGVRRIVMLTGDNEAAAGRIASACKLDGFHANLLPEEKVERVEALEKENAGKPGRLVFVGDGINDSPVLAKSDVGVAMGAMGSDAAIEAADVVLMNDKLTQLASAIAIARRVRTIVVQNIVAILAVKALFIALGTLGLADMWEAIFADVGITILAVVNSLRAMKA